MTRHDVRNKVMNREGTEKETGEGRGKGQRLEYLPGEFSEGLHWFPEPRGLGLAQHRSADPLPGIDHNNWMGKRKKKKKKQHHDKSQRKQPICPKEKKSNQIITERRGRHALPNCRDG